MMMKNITVKEPSRLSSALKEILIIDTETSGVNPQVHSILSLGVTPLVGEFEEHFFISEPEVIADPRSMAIHGISLDWLSENGESPALVCERFERAVNHQGTSSVILAGHNIAFDIAFMKRLYRVANRAWPSMISHRSLDTHTMLWQLAVAGRIPFDACSSDGAFKHFDCSPPTELRHSALGDAIATKELFLKLLDILE